MLVEGNAFPHPAGAANHSHRQLVGFAHLKARVKRMRRRRVIPVHRLVILEQPNLGNRKEPDGLVPIAVVDVIRTARVGVLEQAGQLVPQSLCLVVPNRLGRLLPRVNPSINKSRCRRFE
jgi:hypothetical protein